MKLYYMAGACSLASHIALYETGLKFEVASLDRKNRTLSDGAEFDKVNSKGYVPVLQLDDGQYLSENVAVLQYIADRGPAGKLTPAAGSIERYRLLEWLAFINSEIHKNFAPLFNPAASDDTKKYMRGNLEKRLGWLDNALGSRTFLMGDAFTVADCYLYTVFNWLGHVGIDGAKWPNLKRHADRIATRPAVISALKAEGLLK